MSLEEVPTMATSDKALTKEQKKWREEDDVRALSEALIIQKDKKRLAAAVKRAKIMATEQEEKAEGMRKVADMRSPMKK